MISKDKWIILKPLQKSPNNLGDLGKIIVATSFEWSPKVQKTPNLVTSYYYLDASISIRLEDLLSRASTYLFLTLLVCISAFYLNVCMFICANVCV